MTALKHAPSAAVVPRIRSERPAFDLHYPHIMAGNAPRGIGQTIPEPVDNNSARR